MVNAKGLYDKVILLCSLNARAVPPGLGFQSLEEAGERKCQIKCALKKNLRDTELILFLYHTCLGTSHFFDIILTVFFAGCLSHAVAHRHTPPQGLNH